MTEGDKKIQTENISAAIEVMNERFEEPSEHLTISVRAKDKNGNWYFTVSVISFENLQHGTEIIIGDYEINKLIVKCNKD